MSDVIGTKVETREELLGNGKDVAPGTFCIARMLDGVGLLFSCPCGCGELRFVAFEGMGDGSRKTWKWDGDEKQPTIEGEIIVPYGCGWRGRVAQGVFAPTLKEKADGA